MSKSDSSKDPLIKSIGSIVLGLIVLALVYNVFFTPGAGMLGYGGGHGMSGDTGMHGGGGYGMAGGYGINSGFSLGGLLAGILMLLIRLLSILLVVGLVVGVWVLIREYLQLDGNSSFASLTRGFTGNKMSCPNCGSSVETRWDYCPDCGKPLTKENKAADPGDS